MDTGLDQDHAGWGQITDAYHTNMDKLREATLSAGKFAWQLLWTGGDELGVGNTCPHAIVSQKGCAAALRSLCNETAPPQTRAMMYALNTGHDPSVLPEMKQDLANFLLVRGPFAWLCVSFPKHRVFCFFLWLTSCVDWLRSGHGWKGCSKNYPFPPEFDLDYVSAAPFTASC